MELALTSAEADQLWNARVWDPTSGTVMMTYKGGTSSPKTLCIVGSEYLLSSQPGKPIIQVWSLQKKDQLQIRIICPGIVNSLTATPDGIHCIAAIGEKLHVWEVSTGNLLAVLSRHYQKVSCLHTTDDGNLLLSGGEDCIVLVWNLGRILSSSRKLNSLSKNTDEIMYTWSHHTLPVTDIYVGKRGSISRTVTCSLDNTCKVYDLCSGNLLTTIVLDVSLHSVAMDPAEFHIYIGTADGKIVPINLYEMPKTDSYHHNCKDGQMPIFIGHSKPVCCLSVSMDGQLLLSGSLDNTAKIWDTNSGQCIHTAQHSGSVSNAYFIPHLKNVLSSDSEKPFSVVKSFQRNLWNIEEKGSTVVSPVTSDRKIEPIIVPDDFVYFESEMTG